MPMMPPGMPPGMPPPGGAPPQASGGMPPAGGIGQLLAGAAGGPGGGMIAQVIQRLMSDPAAIKGMMNFMQGQAPTAGMPAPPSAGGPMPVGTNPPGGPPGAPPPGGPPGQGGPPVGDQAEAMARDQIDKAGQTWDGVDAPTKGDIKRLEDDPSASNIKSFDAQFGKGMAEKYLGSQEEPGENPQEEEGESPSEETAESDE